MYSIAFAVLEISSLVLMLPVCWIC